MTRLLKYLTRYRIRDMAEMIRNGKSEALPCSQSLAGKTAVITGATSGIGLETARLFAEKGAELVCVNRDPHKSEALKEELEQKHGARVNTVICDFTSLAQVRRACDQLAALGKPIDIFIANAGVYCTDRTFTPDGIETVFQVNHLASFLMIHRLRQKFIAEGRARIVYVNSEGHRFALAGVHTEDLEWRRHRYRGLRSYGAAKTAQLLTMLRFADLFRESGVTINAMHPGNVRTNIGAQNGERYLRYKERHVLKSARSPVDSAKALYYLAASPQMAGVSGRYFSFTTEERPAPHARDREAVEAVWRKSLQLCGIA
jgi:NAD(P)-dependent dehydrogenase (short-subunit alcohol dehydrogenase family)